MKKSLLIAAALLTTLSINAQFKVASQKVDIKNLPTTTEKPVYQVAEAQMYDGTTPRKAPAKVAKKENVTARYARPAGGFYSSRIIVDNQFSRAYYAPSIFVKPFYEYTWRNLTQSDAAEVDYTWKWWRTVSGEEIENTDNNVDLVTSFNLEADDVPELTAVAGSAQSTYQLTGTNYNDGDPQVYTSTVYAVDNWYRVNDTYRIFSTSHYYGTFGSKTGERFSGTYYTGATPHGLESTGYWFGTNDAGIDAVCQVFEKPEHPYALKSVGILPSLYEGATAETELQVNVYKIPETQEYLDGENVIMYPEQLELVATGKLTGDDSYALITPLYVADEDDPSLTYEVTLHVDYPIMVEITGYNGPLTEINTEKDGYPKLVREDSSIPKFSMAISNDQEDEGFGEQAYLKYYNWRTVRRDATGAVVRDDAKNVLYDVLDEPYYTYEGLNNFFSSGEMKTGFGIYIEKEENFIIFNYSLEDGEYKFPDEGGAMKKTYVYSDGTVETEGVEVFTSYPSEEWSYYVGDFEDVPEWLTIDFEDEIDPEEGEFSGTTTIKATAEPLPEGVTYREADVIFEYAGVEPLVYHFSQGEKPAGIKGDVNGDGVVNVSDVTSLVNMILEIEPMNEEVADVNGDGSVNVSDVTDLVNLILTM